LPSLPTCPPCPMYPSCAQSVPALNVSRLLRADGQEFAADAGHDTHSDESCPDRHADARHTGAGESPFADARLERSKERRPAAAACPRASPPRPWRRTCRGTVRPHLLDLQLPRRRQTSAALRSVLLAIHVLPSGNRRDGVHGSSLCNLVWFVLPKGVCAAVPTRGATWRPTSSRASTRVIIFSVRPAPLFKAPRAPEGIAESTATHGGPQGQRHSAPRPGRARSSPPRQLDANAPRPPAPPGSSATRLQRHQAPAPPRAWQRLTGGAEPCQVVRIHR